MQDIKLGNKVLKNVAAIKAPLVEGGEGLYVDSSDATAASAIPIEISTASEMTALFVAANVGKVYKFIGTTDDTYINGDLYEVVTA